MDRTNADSFPLPTCAECRALGKYMPPLLVEVEDHFGVDTLHAFLKRHAGRKVWVAMDPGKAAPGSVEAFLSARLGGGSLPIPQGPVSFTFRRRIALLHALQRGASVNEASRITGYCERSIYANKADFSARGLLPETPLKGPNP